MYCNLFAGSLNKKHVFNDMYSGNGKVWIFYNPSFRKFMRLSLIDEFGVQFIKFFFLK